MYTYTSHRQRINISFFHFQNKHLAVEPIDFENFILKNKTLIQNDPQRELLLYPTDDVSVSKKHGILIHLFITKECIQYIYTTHIHI